MGQDLERFYLKDGQFTCFHRIRELTKREFVARGDNGNVRRWAESGRPDQKWLIVPSQESGYYHLISVENGEFMGVGSNGNIVVWQESKGPEQQFSFVNRRAADGSYNIRERTANEHVAVGHDGNILRWAPNRNDDQRFILEPVDVRNPRKAEPSSTAGKPRHEPEAIPHPPITSVDASPPERSEEFLIGVERLPAVLVSDPRLPDRIHQVQEQPYYFLVRKRYWERIYNNRLASILKQKVEATARRGMTVTHAKQVETTLGVVVSAKVGLKNKKVSGELSTKFSYQRKELTKDETKIDEYVESKVTHEVTPTTATRLVAWQAVDSFELLDKDERPVYKWQDYDHKQVDWVAFPAT